MFTIENSEHHYPGARWWKFDFHAHTPESVDYGKGPDQASLKETSPQDWLLGFMRSGVDCVAITDHNSGAWIDRLKDSLQELQSEPHPDFRELHIFPGVELSVNGGFHLLAIFDPSVATSDIDSLIGAVDYNGAKGDSNGVTTKSPIEVVDIVLARGGIPIPAHTDQPKGLLRLNESAPTKAALDANTIIQVFNCPSVLAMEVFDISSRKPVIYEEQRIGWSEVLGSDSHHLVAGTQARFPGSHFTWVKMAQPSIGGLRLALLDGMGLSIRRSDANDYFEPPTLPKHYIQSIEIKECRYMGRGQSQEVKFSPWFNGIAVDVVQASLL